MSARQGADKLILARSFELSKTSAQIARIDKMIKFIIDFLKWGRYGFDRGSLSLGCESRGSTSLKRQSL